MRKRTTDTTKFVKEKKEKTKERSDRRLDERRVRKEEEKIDDNARV